LRPAGPRTLPLAVAKRLQDIHVHGHVHVHVHATCTLSWHVHVSRDTCHEAVHVSVAVDVSVPENAAATST